MNRDLQHPARRAHCGAEPRTSEAYVATADVTESSVPAAAAGRYAARLPGQRSDTAEH